MFFIPIPAPAFTLPILHKSRMRRRACADLCGGAIREDRPYRVNNPVCCKNGLIGYVLFSMLDSN